MSPDRNLDPDEGGGSLAEDRDYPLRAVDRVWAILDLLQQSVDGISLNTVVEGHRHAEVPGLSPFTNEAESKPTDEAY